jgi:hypothetical protein
VASVADAILHLFMCTIVAEILANLYATWYVCVHAFGRFGYIVTVAIQHNNKALTVYPSL